MRIAIITGASSGIGRAFAKYVAEYDEIDVLWLVARRRERLEALCKELPKPARILEYDLTEQESIRAIRALLEQESPEVGYLINAAGFGKFSTYADLTLQETNDMIDLNCKACVDLTVASIPYMRRGSRILEIVSTSAFQPLPGLNIYASTKAFLLHYTRALRWELWGKGIWATAVCPYWVKTEFMEVAKDTKNGNTVRFFPFASTPQAIARRALRLNRMGVAVATCSVPGIIQRFFTKIIPHCLIMGIWTLTRKL
ncbi:MAG: SDR family NAD(P)-dependent oxidoreductase [Oscillospiraceae bacterium]|nr:SDR family NAD(P)-dependent oxidoreductase [Oscillospiraceae bacterium]